MLHNGLLLLVLRLNRFISLRHLCSLQRFATGIIVVPAIPVMFMLLVVLVVVSASFSTCPARTAVAAADRVLNMRTAHTQASIRTGRPLGCGAGI